MYDIGKCMGIYFYVIGLVQIISILVIQQITGNIYLDLQFIGWLVAGYYLMKHHEKSRKIIIIVCGIIIVIQGMLFLYTSFSVLPEHATWKIMGFPIEGDNAEKYLRFGSLIVGLIFTIPFFVLKSEKAKKEFSNY